MKKLLFVLLTLFFVSMLGCNKSDEVKDEEVSEKPDSTSEETLKIVPRTNVLKSVRLKKSLKIGVEPEAPPMYNYVNGKHEGFDFEFAQLIAKELDPEIQVYPDTAAFADLPLLLSSESSSQTDMIMGGQIADESIKGVSWSDGYASFGYCLVVKKGSAIKKIDQLKDKIIGVYDEYAKTWVKENIPGVKDIIVEPRTFWFDILEKGKVDAIIYDYPFAVSEIEQFENLTIVISKIINSDFDYVIGISEQNNDFLDKINQSIKKVKQTQEYNDLVLKYFSSESISKPTVKDASKTYIVKKGDTFIQIAAKQLGSADKWTELWEANDWLGNPNLIRVGDIIFLP